MKSINASDFWQWAYSDFMSNALRGVLAEYIVAHAANCTHCPRTEWDARTNQSAKEASRSADLYVFCVFSAKEKESADPLNPSQWFFLMCPTSLLNERLETQKSVSLSSLEAIGLKRLSFEALSAAVAYIEPLRYDESGKP